MDFTLTIINPSVPSWAGLDNNGKQWTLICFAGGSTCEGFLFGSGFYGAQAFASPGCTCDPLMLVFNEILAAFPFCMGTITLTITV